MLQRSESIKGQPMAAVLDVVRRIAGNILGAVARYARLFRLKAKSLLTLCLVSRTVSLSSDSRINTVGAWTTRGAPAGVPNILLPKLRQTMRVAVFVDAGYLYAAGSATLVGSNQPRSTVDLNLPGIVDKLKSTADSASSGASLLRIYWYDGVLRRGVSQQQQDIADTADVKLRLGVLSQSGQQKGVDALLVTDLVELARNRAISDAVLLSGDEDVRIGVQIAQSFGVRVHLIGIEPSRGNQSRTLMQEADSTAEWSKSEIAELLTVRSGSQAGIEDTSTKDDSNSALDEVIIEYLETLHPDQIREVAGLGKWDQIPNDIDSRLLGVSGGRLDRDLDRSERKYLRDEFKAAARRRTDAELN